MDRKRVIRILYVVGGVVFGYAILGLCDYCGLIPPHQRNAVVDVYVVVAGLAIASAILAPSKDKKDKKPKDEQKQ